MGKSLKKLLGFNCFIIATNVILFSKIGLHIPIIGGSAIATAFSVSAIFVMAALFFWGNFKILNPPAPKELPTIKYKDIDTIEECYDTLKLLGDRRTFSEKMSMIEDQLRRFEKKRKTLNELLLQRFNESEMSYSKFVDPVQNVELVLCLNIRSILNRIGAFDESEYYAINHSGMSPSIRKAKLEIFNEYISFVNTAVEDNEMVILKLDKLISEVSKLDSLSPGEVKDMVAMKEIEELISSAKWYKD